MAALGDEIVESVDRPRNNRDYTSLYYDWQDEYLTCSFCSLGQFYRAFFHAAIVCSCEYIMAYANS